MTRKVTTDITSDPKGNKSNEPTRKCIATGEIQPKTQLIRFVTSPDGQIVPDFKETLPGRGIWVSCHKDSLEIALKKGLFSKAAKRKVSVSETLSTEIEKVLISRCLNILGLCRKSGVLNTGFAKVEASLKSGKAAVLIAASDGSKDGTSKMERFAKDLPLVDIFDRAELSQAIGRDNAVHLSLAPSRLADRFVAEVSKLKGFRDQGKVGERTGSE